MESCVLVVEDNEDLQFLYKRAMSLEGYDVQMASNGREALDYLSTATVPPSVIVLDLMMPVMDGFQFLEIKEADSKIKNIPVVVCSASKEKSRVPKNIEFIGKPVDLDTLLNVIEKYCPKTM